MPARTPLIDNFDRANEGPPPSASWGNINAGLKVVSNQCQANAANSISYYNVAQYGPDCETRFTVKTKPGNGVSVALLLRAKDVGSIATLDGYMLLLLAQAGTDIVRVQSITNSVATTIGADVNQEYSVNDEFIFRGVGSALEGEQNGSVIISRTDATYSAAGYLAVSIEDTTGVIDDFGGGTLISHLALLGVG